MFVLSVPYFPDNCFNVQSTSMMESFMKLAKSNTDKNLETCGILAGLLVSDFRILFLVLKQQAR